MTAYVVASLVELKDPDLMTKYAESATLTVAAHRGKFLASGDIEKLDGEWNAVSGVVIEFPNKEAAKAWYDSAAQLDRRVGIRASHIRAFEAVAWDAPCALTPPARRR